MNVQNFYIQNCCYFFKKPFEIATFPFHHAIFTSAQVIHEQHHHCSTAEPTTRTLFLQGNLI